MPNPEAAAVKETSEASSSSAQSSTIPETEVELAESVSVSDEPVAAVTSSVTLAEASPEQTPTETNTGIRDFLICLLLSLLYLFCYSHIKADW